MYPASLKPVIISFTLLQDNLDLSVQKNIWATQHHKEEILDQAYRTSKDVFLFLALIRVGSSMDMPVSPHFRFAFLCTPNLL